MTYSVELMQSGREFCHLLFDIFVLRALLFQLLFHLVESLHHLLLLLCLGVAFTLFLFELLLQLMVLCCEDVFLLITWKLYFEDIHLLNNHTHLFSFSRPAPSTASPHFHWPACIRDEIFINNAVFKKEELFLTQCWSRSFNLVG